MEHRQFKIGDRVTTLTPTELPTGAGRKGVIIEIHKPTGLAVIAWDDRDFLGFDISTKNLDNLRKVK